MSGTANLNLEYISESATRPDIQHNDALDAIDAALSETLDVDVMRRAPAVRPYRVLAGTHRIVAGAAVAADVTVTLARNGSAYATATITTGNSSATFSATATDFAAGDVDTFTATTDVPGGVGLMLKRERL